MRTLIFRYTPIVVHPFGEMRWIPAHVGSAAPLDIARSPRPLEHPQNLSRTVEIGSPPWEPTNDSTLALERPL